MRWKKLLWKGFAGLLFCSFAFRGCSMPEPQRIILEKPTKKLELDGKKFDLEKATITQYYNFRSENIVAFIMDRHFPKKTEENKEYFKTSMELSSAIHRENYRTLEELASENNAKFLGLEAYYGEFSKNHLELISKKLTAIFEMIADIEPEKRKKEIEFFCFKHGTFYAGYGFELVNDERIFSYGVEDKELYEKAIRIGKAYEKAIRRKKEAKRFKKTEAWKSLTEKEQREMTQRVLAPWFILKGQFQDTIIVERSRVFVDKLMEGYKKWSKDGNKSKVLILVGGYAHYESVAERLEELNISYILIRPDSLRNYNLDD